MKVERIAIIALCGLVGLAFVEGLAKGTDSAAEIVNSQVVWYGAQKFHNEVQSLKIVSDGLSAKLKGVRTVKPRTVIKTETVFAPPQTAIGAVNLQLSAGRVSYLNMTMRDTSGPLYSSEIYKDVNLARCKRASIAGDGVLCEPYRIGVLSAFADAAIGQGAGISANARAGLEFARYPQASWSLRLFADTEGRVNLGLRWRRKLLAW